MRKEGKELGDLMEKYLCETGKKELDQSTMPSENCDEEDLFLTKRDIFEILEDNQIPLVKKKDYLETYDIKTFTAGLQLEQFCRIMEINEKAKNYKVSEFCGNIMKQWDFQETLPDLLIYLDKRKFSQNQNFHLLNSRILKQPTHFFVALYLQ